MVSGYEVEIVNLGNRSWTLISFLKMEDKYVTEPFKRHCSIGGILFVCLFLFFIMSCSITFVCVRECVCVSVSGT